MGFLITRLSEIREEVIKEEFYWIIEAEVIKTIRDLSVVSS